MRRKVENTVERYGMLKGGETVIVGVSGGADSTALGHILCALSEKMRLTVIAAHLHHGLRGEEADRDEAHVRELCAKWGILCVTEHADCAALAKASGEGLEECGRRLRYEFFSRVASGYENARIATAHSADDNLETLLFNLTRGASLKGMCGILPVRGNIIRPLIDCSRVEIEAYCLENDLLYMTDSTNLSCEYSRNLLRSRAVPVLKSVNPNAVFAARRLTELVTQDEAYFQKLTDGLYEEALRGKNTFDAAVLKEASPSLRSRLFIRVYEAETGNSISDTQLLGRVENVLYGGKKVQLQKNLYAELTGGMLRFIKNAAPKVVFSPLTVGNLPFFCDTGLFSVRITAENAGKINRLFTNNDVDCDTICGGLVLRGRVEGDRLTLPRRKVTKSLKKLFSEEHIDIGLRGAVPVLADDKGVVWVQGFGANSANAASENTKSILRIEGERTHD